MLSSRQDGPFFLEQLAMLLLPFCPLLDVHELNLAQSRSTATGRCYQPLSSLQSLACDECQIQWHCPVVVGRVVATCFRIVYVDIESPG